MIFRLRSVEVVSFLVWCLVNLHLNPDVEVGIQGLVMEVNEKQNMAGKFPFKAGKRK